MDMYSMFQSDGINVTIIRFNRETDPTTGAIKPNRKIESIRAAEIPPTIGLREQKTTFAEAHAFLLLDTFRAEELSLYPIQIDDWIILRRKAYQVHDIGFGQSDQELLIALRLIVGAVPFNIEEVAVV